MHIWLVILFFLTALLYASVGFGGGSTYTALLILADTDYRLIPIISLLCNIAVVSSNTVQYTKARLIEWRKIWPFLALSIPFAWIGGRIEIPRTVFILLLACALLIAGIGLLRQNKTSSSSATRIALPFKLGIGAALGMVSGLVGIGGGIFLAPILHKIRFGSAKQIAALCSLFILLNSASGLIGQLMKNGAQILMSAPAYTFWLFPGVILGGLIGNRISIVRLSQSQVRKLTALLILFVAFRLFFMQARELLLLS